MKVDLMGEQVHGHVDHVTLTHKADLLIIAPATANTIARLAGGHAGDWITVTALGVRCPVLVAPSMEAEMYANPLTQRNLRILAELGWEIMEPEEGRLASGLVGKGRLPEPAKIVERAVALLQKWEGRKARLGGDLAGRRVLVTAGTTREPFDPVRFIGNRSTGRMGYAIAEPPGTGARRWCWSADPPTWSRRPGSGSSGSSPVSRCWRRASPSSRRRTLRWPPRPRPTTARRRWPRPRSRRRARSSPSPW
ncbi:MAG: hypothetical protein A6D92_14345 [Symbiobacterium thermophilum]|uniref:Flavoprotein domain-containing protein n=1 Tax=Symbiobacterium thermophilum TaxID=2734 RepID=A0A1Y2T2Y0_SYMTR|nr:MAG: hypothetical protein A6D92_14345 [Symbiobacterium thermophilum]